MSKRESTRTFENDTMQQALLEIVRQNGRLLDELQAARQREDDLVDRVFLLEDQLRRSCFIGTKSSTESSTSSIQEQEEDQVCENASKKNLGEELVEWKRVPHYEIIVNGKIKAEGFVANNSCVSFIRPEVVRRAKLKPYTIKPAARFNFWDKEEQVVAAEAVMVPMQMGEYRGEYPMFIYQVRSEIILGSNWLQNEHVHWVVDYMLVGPRNIRVNPKPPILVKKSDPRASARDSPVIIERLT